MVECESYGVFNALIFLTVLIDTWWNVNEELEWFVDTVISFNRYMVECEFVNDADCFFCIHSFNRYMVECEYNNKNNHSYDHKCFNRYMVECESVAQG